MNSGTIRINSGQAEAILKAGQDRAEGVVIPLVSLKQILHDTSNCGAATLYERLPSDVALGFFNDTGDGAKPPTVTLSRKALEDIVDGIERDGSHEQSPQRP